MREDNADKSAREGLVNYAAPLDSRVQRTKPCGCPLAGCTVDCIRRQRSTLKFRDVRRAEELDNIP